MSGSLPLDRAPWTVRRSRGLLDPDLRRAATGATRRLQGSKEAAYAEYPQGEERRRRAVEAKRRAIRQLDALLERLTGQVEARGGHVFRARGPEEVAGYVLEVARRRSARQVVKSKSMATEEVELNARLEAGGLRVRETDLGEYIIQLAGERPAHILAPAAHKSRAQVRRLFEREAREAGEAPPAGESPEELTAFARRRLREEFLRAEIGITGGNFLVAETGTLVLFTNEGNGRMVTSLPPVHIAVVGVEKVVATWEDLADLIEQPPLSGVGQRLSSYVSLLSGPRHPGELDGPEEFHLILLDNGRSELLGTEFEDVLSCIRCGACLNACPVFRNVGGGHAYGSIYSGPIGVVLTPLLAGLEKAPELPKSLCSMCHACGEACPMEIDLPGHILRLRRQEAERGLEPRGYAAMLALWSRLWSSPSGFVLSARLGRLGQRAWERDGRLTGGPGPFSAWFVGRDMAPLARESFHEWWRRNRGGAR
ncbi:MAG: LutB/LldF family L-lactate oxidation iron-sulfur protein [Bacillota bacterium]|nr:LutB/LldF family L-lactate oxidation iron-sulfur protein [Bacillota bacterium]MDI3318000.1 LutB/LldF family L-lactate oxidation iron-sulfur protein [Bacillota bacterium]